MESMTLEELFLYCRVDNEEQKLLAEDAASHAERRLLSMGIPLNAHTRSDFALAVKAMAVNVLDHPDNPGDTPGIRALINQLKFNH